MKPRKVMIHLEVKTNVPLKDLRQKRFWVTWIEAGACLIGEGAMEIHQVTAQVVKEGK